MFQGALAAALASTFGCASNGTDSAPPASGGADDGGDAATIDAADEGDAGAESDAASEACDPVDDLEAPSELCGYPRILPCGLPPLVGPMNGCHLSIDDCYSLCNSPVVYDCAAWQDSCLDGGVLSDAAPVHLDCTICLGGPGRRPDGLRAPRRDSPATPLARELADAAYLERASILAFARLGADLRDLGAPAALVELAKRSARDELRHARTMSRLARDRGATPARPRVAPRTHRRSLEEVARENAVEGCVGETYAALVAAWQASHAKDRSVARAMRSIAKDELWHAAFAWAVARWAEARLDRDARERVRRAREQAVVALRRGAFGGRDPDAIDRAGLPSPAAARVLLDRLERELWS